MTTLTAAQTLSMLGKLGAGALNDVFSQDELQRLFDEAASDINLAIYYGWQEIAGDSAKWVNYKVAQTSVNRGDAFDHIIKMLDFWSKESRTNANQLQVLGLNQIPPHLKPRPADETLARRGYLTRSRWFPY